MVDRIGQADNPDPSAVDHITAAKSVLERLDQQDGVSFDVVGHRIVHGGATFQEPTPVTAEVLVQLQQLDSLAPLHNPHARRVVEALAELGVPQALVFDTAYFSTLPESAFRYALPTELFRQYGVRRYGFHGTSHQFVTKRAIEYLSGLSDNFKRDSCKIISLHLGGGASATASVGGKAVDTSMGMTPLEGLVMATRCGDIDPAIPVYLMAQQGMSAEEVDSLMNQQSGLLGLCGECDMRQVLQRANDGDCEAKLAVDIFVRKIIKTIGSYIAILGGLDALIFTAGIGEHAAEIRQRIVDPLAHFGIEVDSTINHSCAAGVVDLSAGPVKVLVVPTDEELAIARQVSA
ncbi:UNVERIFIED_CONTAM: hypothetical protein GTU68_035493 [Idotea baltica]|nr:hypothetical protein [Idotea baltica]